MDLTIAEPTPVFLPGESQGWRSLVGCHLWGRTESDTTEATQQQQQQKQNGLRRGGKNTQKNYTKKVFMTWITTMVWSLTQSQTILEGEVEWALGSFTMNKAGRGDGIPADLFQVLQDETFKVLHSVYQ